MRQPLAIELLVGNNWEFRYLAITMRERVWDLVVAYEENRDYKKTMRMYWKPPAI